MAFCFCTLKLLLVSIDVKLKDLRLSEGALVDGSGQLLTFIIYNFPLKVFELCLSSLHPCSLQHSNSIWLCLKLRPTTGRIGRYPLLWFTMLFCCGGGLLKKNLKNVQFHIYFISLWSQISAIIHVNIFRWTIFQYFSLFKKLFSFKTDAGFWQTAFSTVSTLWTCPQSSLP